MRLAVKDISFAYGGAGVLHGLAAAVADGEVVSIIGPNGSGKSTLLRCMARILKPKQGAVYLNGKELSTYSGPELAKQMGYVPQVAGEVFPLTVLETVLLGRKPHLSWEVSSKDLAVVGAVLQEMGLEHLADRYMDQLSGGQKQKVMLARALAQEPAVLLLDEPTSALDIRHQLEVLEFVRDLAHRRRRAVVLVLHDLNLAARFSDQLILLKNGRVFAAGRPEETLTAATVSAVYGVEATVTNDKFGLQVYPIRSLEKQVLQLHDIAGG